MENSGKSPSVDLVEVVDARLRPWLNPQASVLLALSGGVDSVVLLDLLDRLAPRLQFHLRAVHVHHGISPNAEIWSAFCAELCRDRGVPFILQKVDIAPYRRLGIEGAARSARYRALASVHTDIIALAQHRDDQAETLLLHLLRASGAKGLAGMPMQRGIAGSEARLVRPLLQTARSTILAYAAHRGLQWIDDESNEDVRLKRNFLRQHIFPALERGFGDARSAIVRSAANLGDAAELLDQLGDEDLERLRSDDGMEVAGLMRLSPARARNALRRWCEQAGLPWPGTARLDELLRQLQHAHPDALINIGVGGRAFRHYRGRLYLECVGRLDSGFRRQWSGEHSIDIPECGGSVRFERVQGRGLAARRIGSQVLELRARRGGEKLQPDLERPRRTLKNLFQERGIPPWRRDALPLVFCGDELVCVPGVGEACHWRAAGNEAGWRVYWESNPRTVASLVR